jgi:hypothetical protein
LVASGADISGTINATSGTFRGTIYATNGEFGGTLKSAGGTFTGTLNGVDGNFSGSIGSSTANAGNIYTSYLSATSIKCLTFNGVYTGGGTWLLPNFEDGLEVFGIPVKSHVLSGGLSGSYYAYNS